MIRIVKTSVDGSPKHYHYLMFDDEDESIMSYVVSENKDHTHPVFLFYDDNSDAEIVKLAEFDEHSHETTDEEILPTDEIEIKIPVESDKDILDDKKNMFVLARDREENPKAKGSLAEKFFMGNQWIDNDGIEIPKEKNKSYITSNLIQSMINIIFGVLRNNRTQIKYVPTRQRSTLLADTVNMLLKAEQTANNSEFVENQVVKDAINTGRGSWYVYINRDRDPRGNVVIKRLPWRNVYFGEHDGMAAEDAEYVMFAEYVTKKKAMNMVKPSERHNLSSAINMIKEGYEQGDKYDNGDGSNSSEFIPGSYNEKTKEFRVLNVWQKEHVPIYTMILGDFIHTSSSEIPDKEQFKSLGFLFFERERTFVRYQKFLSESIILKDEVAELDELPIVPAYYKKTGDDFAGKVYLGISLQRVFNKVISKCVDFINKSVNDIIYYDKDTLAAPNGSVKHEETLKKMSTTGGAIQVKNQARTPVHATQSHLPPYLVNFMQEIKQLMQIVYNLNSSSLGESTPESGIKVMQNKQQSIIGNECFTDNLLLTKKHLGRVALKALRICYGNNPDRIERVLDNNRNNDEEKEFVWSDLSEAEKNKVASELSDELAEELDVFASQAPSSPTTKMSEFMFLMESVNAGHFQLPIEALVTMTPFFTEKQKQMIMNFMAEQRQQEANARMSDSEAQVERTKVAGQLDIVNTVVKETMKSDSSSK